MRAPQKPHRLALLFFWLVALHMGLARAQPPDPARELERHILAPCCYRETLDVHTSPLATELRAELRRRIAAGESAAALEAELIQRYGAKVRTHIPESLGIWLALAASLLGGLAFYLFRNRQRGARSPGEAEPKSEAISKKERSQYEAQLDDELED